MENKNWLKKLFRKRKKAFTLIELLAIIVILAIIAVITVPIILNIIENAKKGAATNSAYGYKDAISKFYASKLTQDSDYEIPNGLHTKSYFDTMGVLINGKEPASNSFLRTYKNMVTSGCLQFDEYKVEFVDGKVSNTEKGTCKQVNIIYTDVNNNGKIDLADTVKIENDEFYIIAPPADGKVKLLAKYDLNSNSRQENGNNPSVKFAESNYWANTSNFNQDRFDKYYVYRNKNNQDVSNNVNTYIDDYKNYLVGLGAYFVTDGRLMSYAEAKDIGCGDYDSGIACPDWASNQAYWLGSSDPEYQNIVFAIYSSDKTIGRDGFTYTEKIRPLIEIYESAITDEYTITFDSRGGGDVPERKIVTGEKIGTLPTNLSKENAVFEGWYTDKEYTTKISSNTIPVGSTKYYARYVLSKAEYTDSNSNGLIEIGEPVKILDDYFYVVAPPSNGKVKLLAKYDLNYSSRQENGHNPSVKFAESNYWSGNSLSNYNQDRFDKYYVYRNKTNQDGSNNLASYINNYKTYLNRQGAEFVTDARVMSYAEAKDIGCGDYDSGIACPDWASNQAYWLGSSDTQYNNIVFAIYSDKSIGRNGFNYTEKIRPVIEVDENALNSHYTITFDSKGGSAVQSMTVNAGSAIGTLPANPTKTNATFVGWYSDSEYTSDMVTTSTVPVGTTKYYAKWNLTKAEYTDVGNDGINLGDTVRILDDEFYVIAAPDNNKVKLLAKYDLNTNSRQENGHNPSVKFAESNYWSGNNRSNYSQDGYNQYYVYRSSSGTDGSNNLANYINNYYIYLTGQGAGFVTDVRVMSYAEAKGIGCGDYNSGVACPSWAYNQTYWLGSNDPSYQNIVYAIYSSGTIGRNGFTYTEKIRPLVEINLSALQ